MLIPPWEPFENIDTFSITYQEEINDFNPEKNPSNVISTSHNEYENENLVLNEYSSYSERRNISILEKFKDKIQMETSELEKLEPSNHILSEPHPIAIIEEKGGIFLNSSLEGSEVGINDSSIFYSPEKKYYSCVYPKDKSLYSYEDQHYIVDYLNCQSENNNSDHHSNNLSLFSSSFSLRKNIISSNVLDSSSEKSIHNEEEIKHEEKGNMETENIEKKKKSKGKPLIKDILYKLYLWYFYSEENIGNLLPKKRKAQEGAKMINMNKKTLDFYKLVIKKAIAQSIPLENFLNSSLRHVKDLVDLAEKEIKEKGPQEFLEYKRKCKSQETKDKYDFYIKAVYDV